MDSAFATLAPANALARLAFSDVYDTLMSRNQANRDGDGTALPLRLMKVEPEQKYNSQVLRLRREAGRDGHDTDGEASASLTEPDTDTEEQMRELGMIWTGCYLLRLDMPPALTARGWAAGKGPLENTSIDLLLCTKPFAKSNGINLRNPHAYFNFYQESKGFYIKGCSRSPSAQVSVNGDAVARQPYHLNQHTMKVQLDKLEYQFKWTEFAAQPRFLQRRALYIRDFAVGTAVTNNDLDMPTPLPGTQTIGRWTLRHALGAGGSGRVFFASDERANVAAIKVVERTSRNYYVVDAEIRTLQQMTQVAQVADEHGRILRMEEVIYSNGEEFSTQSAFDNVAMVLTPMTPRTMASLVGAGKGHKGMTMEAATAFRTALLGVKVMHDSGWLHRDLKPTNIGLIGQPPRSVLLDIGTSKYIPAGTSLPPQPGRVGTIGYLAPELELENYDYSVDIWSMGVILFELTYNYRPWKLSTNPWRDGKANEALRPAFRKSYQVAMNKMARDFESASASSDSDCIHRGVFFSANFLRISKDTHIYNHAVGGLFIDMMRYPWAADNHAKRPDINTVLQHPAWGPLLSSGSPQSKKQRLE